MDPVMLKIHWPKRLLSPRWHRTREKLQSLLEIAIRSSLRWLVQLLESSNNVHVTRRRNYLLNNFIDIVYSLSSQSFSISTNILTFSKHFFCSYRLLEELLAHSWPKGLFCLPFVWMPRTCSLTRRPETCRTRSKPRILRYFDWWGFWCDSIGVCAGVLPCFRFWSLRNSSGTKGLLVVLSLCTVTGSGQLYIPSLCWGIYLQSRHRFVTAGVQMYWRRFVAAAISSRRKHKTMMLYSKMSLIWALKGTGTNIWRTLSVLFEDVTYSHGSSVHAVPWLFRIIPLLNMHFSNHFSLSLMLLLLAGLRIRRTAMAVMVRQHMRCLDFGKVFLLQCRSLF